MLKLKRQAIVLLFFAFMAREARLAIEASFHHIQEMASIERENHEANAN